MIWLLVAAVVAQLTTMEMDSPLPARAVVLHGQGAVGAAMERLAVRGRMASALAVAVVAAGMMAA